MDGWMDGGREGGRGVKGRSSGSVSKDKIN